MAAINILDLREMNIKFDKSELSKKLSPELLRKYIERKGWRKIYDNKNGYDIYEYHINGFLTVLIPTPSCWIKMEDFEKTMNLRDNFTSITTTHYIGEFEIVESVFNLVISEVKEIEVA